MTRLQRTRVLVGLAAFSCWCETRADTVELNIVGAPTLDAQLSTDARGRTRVTGRLTDELGQPLSGSIHAEHANGSVIPLVPCENGADGEEQRDGSAIPSDGEFCVWVPEALAQVVLQARAPHFVTVERTLRNDGLPRLPRPRFSQAPQTIEIGEPNPAVVEVLAGSGSPLPVAGARLRLSLSCGSSTFRIDEVPLAGSRLARFEFTAPLETPPGNCEMLADVAAPGHETQTESRNVLVRASVRLALLAIDEGRLVRALLSAETTTGQAVSQGIVEASAAGAHLASAPVEEGRAELHLEPRVAPQEVVVRYVPSGPAYVPQSPISLTLAAREVGARWATIHTLGLLCFFAWLAYAWLRPERPVPTPDIESPGRPLVEAKKSSQGPIVGKIRDAHTGAALANATIQLWQANVIDKTLKETCTSDVDGTFRLKTAFDTHKPFRMKVEVPGYMSLETAIRGAELTLHLSERRREAVRLLIEWTKRAGRPWSAHPAATPAHVKRVATGLQRHSEHRWAEEVERVAYQKEPPLEPSVRAIETPEKFDEYEKSDE